MPGLLQINETANSGSHGIISEGIGRLVLEKGWESVIAYGRWANESQSQLIRIGSSIDVMEHGVESRLFDNHGLASRFSTLAFISHLKEIKPDIIHLHNIHGYYLNYRVLFEYLNSISIPIVWTVHDCWAFTGHCSHFVTSGCEKWKTGCNNCQLTRSYPKSFVDRSKRNYELKKSLFTNNKNLHIVTVSDWLSAQVKHSFFEGKDLRVIKNGVDVELFKPSEIKPNDRFTILGVASVWTQEKGLCDFYGLRDILDKEAIDIVLIGLSDKQIKELPNGITGIPRTESVDELVLWYNKADVILSLSKAETFGLTIAEALACGTPVVVYDNTAQPELVSDETGYIVKTGDIGGVAIAIESLRRRSAPEVKAQSNACRDRAEREFNISRCLGQYLDMYEDLTR